MICPWCNAENNEEAAFCKSCGRLLPEPEIIDEEPEKIVIEDENKNPETTESLEKTETSETTEEIIEKSETTELIKAQEKEIITNESEIIRNTQTVISTLSNNLEKQKRVSGIFLALAILFSLSTIGTGILAYNYYTDYFDLADIQSKFDSLNNRFNNLSDSYSWLASTKQLLENDKRILENDYNALLESDVFVRVTKIYNDADNSEYLDHSTITYLDFDYTVSKAKNIKDSDTLYVKIINPDDSLRKGSSSPSGYTWAETVGSDWWGWGNKTPGSAYTKGYHTIEFWFKGRCVGRKRFYIN